MRLANIRGFSRSTSYSFANPGQPPRHRVTLWEQPLHRWLIATIYHRYDTLAYRLPGFRALEGSLRKLHRGDEHYIPLGARQDIRCYELTHRQRTELATFEVDKQTYDRLRSNGKGAP